MKSILLRLNDGEIDLILDLLENRSYLLSCKIEGFGEEKREPKAEDIQEYQLINDIQDKIGLTTHTIRIDADIINKKGENYLDSLEVSSIRLNNVDYQTTGTGGNCTALTTQVDNFTIMITNECQIPNSLESEVVIGIYDNESCEGDSLNNNTVVKFKDINLELLTKLVKEPQSVLFRVEWIEGYGTTDPRTVSIDELTFDDINHESNQWNMDAYYGDNWISTFINIPVGNSSDCYADGHVKFTRIN
tara:strand:- start:8 stop:748 length:741 start_codon:yes stop_codon:yes gene_type:complete